MSNAKQRRSIDWEAVERDYRAGLLSIREIGKTYDVSDKAIRNKAKDHGWQRNLTDLINGKVRSALVRSQSAVEQSEEEIVDDAVKLQVHIVRGHQKRIGNQVELVDLLTQQLIDVAGKRDQFEDAIDDECKDDENGKRRAGMMKAVSLSTHASVAVNLSNALKTLVGLERQAFSIKDESSTPASALTDLIAQISGTALPIIKENEAE